MLDYLAHCLDLAAGDRPLVVVDLETTGLIVPGVPFPRIWEIGAVLLAGTAPSAEFRRLVKIGQPLPVEANLLGLDPWLPDRDGVDLAIALDELDAFIEETVLVGQRFDAYDAIVLRAAYEALHRPQPPQITWPGGTIDTRLLADALYGPTSTADGPRPAERSLAALARFFEIPFVAEDLHVAIVDARLTAQVLTNLLVEARRRRA